MSEQDNPSNPLFEGFKPQGIYIAPDVNVKENPFTGEKPRKKREPKAVKVPKEPKVAKPQKPRKPRAAKPRAAKPPAAKLPPVLPPQYNLQTILKAMRELHEEDYALFDKLFTAPEASRKRIMASLAKIFP